jgi:hypothetical protein
VLKTAIIMFAIKRQTLTLFMRTLSGTQVFCTHINMRLHDYFA